MQSEVLKSLWVFWVLSGIHNSSRFYRSHKSEILKLQEAQSLFKVTTFDDGAAEIARPTKKWEKVFPTNTHGQTKCFPQTLSPLFLLHCSDHIFKPPTSFHLNYTPVQCCDCMVRMYLGNTNLSTDFLPQIHKLN